MKWYIQHNQNKYECKCFCSIYTRIVVCVSLLVTLKLMFVMLFPIFGPNIMQHSVKYILSDIPGDGNVDV